MLNVLALHGKQQNGELFRTRLGRLPVKLTQNRILSNIQYLDSYYELDAMHEEDDIKMRTWFLRDSNNEIIHSTLEQSLSHIEKIWKESGNFDVIIGFSMGGMMASIIASQPLRFPGLLAILIGGAPDLNCINGDKDWYRSIPDTLYSMHVMGYMDKVVDIKCSHELATKFHNPTVIEHDMGHCLPMKSQYMNTYLEFMKKISQMKSTLEPSKSTMINNSQPVSSSSYYCASDDIALAQKEELEVLKSMYPSDLTIIHDEPNKEGDLCISIHILLDFALYIDKIPNTSWYGNIGIQFTATSEYPLHKPPIINITTGRLSLFDGFNEPQIKSLEAYIYTSLGITTYPHIENSYNQYVAMPCAMTCIQSANDWFEQEMWLLKCNDNLGDTAKMIGQHNSTLMDHDDSDEDDDESSNDIDNNVDDDIDRDELLEKEQIKIATLEAYEIAYKAKSNSNDVSEASYLRSESDLFSESRSINGGILPTSARGIWNYTVGLVGKPSAGKSTFYNAVTKAALQRNGRLVAEVAPHPFTTIEPNIGPGWYASFHNEKEDLMTRHPLHGKVSYNVKDFSIESTTSSSNSSASSSSRSELKSSSITTTALSVREEHRRLLPICVKDVAGLVPGAYKGRGKGNRFLADLCDADVLVHVVDVTGTSDKDGNLIIATITTTDIASTDNSYLPVSVDDLATASSPLEDAEWIREELHRWIYGNIRGKWASVKSKGKANHSQQQQLDNKCAKRVYALFTGYQGPKWCLEVAAKRANLNLNNAFNWSTLDIHRIVAHFLSVRFPICLALNKIDALPEKGYETIIRQCQIAAKSRGEVAVAVSAKSECWLLNQSITAVKVCEDSMSKDEYIYDNVMKRFGSTGVLEAISEAVKLKPPILCYPVCDLESEYPVGWTSGKINLNHTIQQPTTAEEQQRSGIGMLTMKDNISCIPRLQDCLQFKPGSTVGDVFDALKRPEVLQYTTLSGDFVRGEGKSIYLRNINTTDSTSGSGNHSKVVQLRRDTIIDATNCIIRIQTNRKSVWQKK